MGWERAIITDSGGFQVFSLAHGTVADEVKGRRGSRPGRGSVLEIGEQGVRFRSYVDGSERFLGPEESMAVQAQLGSDIALAFDECTPYHADRDYTARSTERTHRWLDRCLEWHAREGPARQAVFGIVQGGVHEDLRQASAELRVGGGGRRRRDRRHAGTRQGGDARRRGDDGRAPSRRTRHATCSASASRTTSCTGSGWGSTSSIAPSRPGLRATAWRSRHARTTDYRLDIRKAKFAEDERPLVDGCPCATCSAHTRAYVHYLSRTEELTGVRLLVVHNLAYLERLVAGARQAIEAGRYGAYREAILVGRSPWDAAGM